MTGQQFVDALLKEIMAHGQLDKEYAPADLTRDAGTIGLWYRKPSTYTEQSEMQEEDLAGARAEVAPLTEKVGGSQ